MTRDSALYIYAGLDEDPRSVSFHTRKSENVSGPVRTQAIDMTRDTISKPTKNKPAGAERVVSVPAQSHVKPVGEWTKAGKLLRERCPLKIHGDWKPFTRRVDPIDSLIDNSRGRVQELILIRYGRMMANPFAFFRGGVPSASARLYRRGARGLLPSAVTPSAGGGFCEMKLEQLDLAGGNFGPRDDLDARR